MDISQSLIHLIAVPDVAEIIGAAQFFDIDGERARPVGSTARDAATGEVAYFRLLDHLRPIIGNVTKFERVIVQRVFPYLPTNDQFFKEFKEEESMQFFDANNQPARGVIVAQDHSENAGRVYYEILPTEHVINDGEKQLRRVVVREVWPHIDETGDLARFDATTAERIDEYHKNNTAKWKKKHGVIG